MDFNFTGSRPVRQINLGGQSGHGQSAAQLAAAARAERAARELTRKRNAAAALIQSSFRGARVARSLRHDLAARFDSLANDLQHNLSQSATLDRLDLQRQAVQLTRLLIFSIGRTDKRYSHDDAQRLATWCRIVTPTAAAVHAPLLVLILTHSATSPAPDQLEADRQSVSLVLLVCRQLLAHIAQYALTLPSQSTLAYFDLLSLLASTDASSPLASLALLPTPSGGPAAQAGRQSFVELALDRLLDLDLHRSLQRFVLSFPVDRKASPAMASAVSLSLAPFRVFRSQPAVPKDGSAPAAAIVVVDDDHTAHDDVVPPRHKAVRSFCVSIMTIPLLANRVPLPSVTEFAAAFPFMDVLEHILALGSYISVATGDSALDDNPLHSPYFLANLLTFGTGRLTHLKDGKAIRTYLEALTIAQDALPSQVFLSPAEWKEQARSGNGGSTFPADFGHHGDDDEDGGDGDGGAGMPSSSSARTGQLGLQDVVMSDGSAARASSSTAASRTVTQAAAASPSPRIPAYTLPLDAQTNKRLSAVVSESHLSALLTASGRFPTSTRQALCSFLCSTLTAWPAAGRERVFNTIMYGYVQPARSAEAAAAKTASGSLQAAKGGAGQLVGGFVRELWRGQIRGNPLARTLAAARHGSGTRETLATLSDAGHSSEWPAFVLICELYSRCLLTIGDDEFYPPSSSVSGLGGGPAMASRDGASSRNPLTLDEVVSLSAILRNLAFAMYWYEGSGPLANLDGDDGRPAGSGVAAPSASSRSRIVPRVPGMKLPLLSLRNLLTKLLQQLHARDSRRRFTPDDHWLMVSQLDLQSFIQTVILEERELNGAPHQSMPPSELEADAERSRSPRNGTNGRTSDRDARGGDDGDDGDDDDDGRIPPLPVAERLRTRRGQTSKLSARNLAFLSPRLGVLNNIPFVIPFDVRVEIFRQFVDIDAQKLGLARTPFYARQRIKVRRGMIAEDGFAQMNPLGPRLKERLEIAFIDQWGHEEAGIDGGGVYKEFLTSLVREAFDTNRGLWKATDAQELYPNPHSYAKTPDQLEWYTFLGRVLGKALYEGILVDVKFASFFLSKWLGKQGYLDDLASLDSLDKELYRGLIYLKNYGGDVEADLALNFTVTDDEFGVSKTTELVPGGSEVPVTRENRLEYIYRVSHYRLSVQIAEQCRAFFLGLSEMIDPRWLRMMNREELRVLVCGTEEPIDVADLRANTVYGGYHERDVAVDYFWQALESFDQPQRKAFLKFVTSSPNPPLLGFAELNPKFSIRNAGPDATRLPTASTCVNLLKLPEYNDAETCRQKLVYAIQSGAGFDLS
ncbi:uncharacterized protein PFL1_06280 [Pseudozyma flocculosa PF-1]|uniref:HECT-type E3 ubiquitin transferase n=2 Tax=Pseudozyma flocculosa TaxID=84751 RepID=A0A5C3F9J7_9BASI|nr:uncharacterized protein PFL1_06280 [Pseudozyma flocculosa PF-1]EPQ26072.1 hypothetical protein PFL1_06280 [Pseudozyma flocculosa PF-1]SPO40315.1 related to ubiquitin protein ligase e3 [Pseudozyma flocculosa]